MNFTDDIVDDFGGLTDFPQVETGPAEPQPDYDEWLVEGKKLCETSSRTNWQIGDWLVIGQKCFDVQSMLSGVPRYMMLHKKQISGDGSTEFEAIKIPNLWKDAAKQTKMATGTLKDIARCAEAYPPDQRVEGLSYSHHYAVMNYPRRQQYLKACLAADETVNWLVIQAIRDVQGPGADTTEYKMVRFFVAEETFEKLHDVGKFYRTRIDELIHEACNKAVNEYLESVKKKYALDRFHEYDESIDWPTDIAYQISLNRRVKESLAEARRNGSVAECQRVAARGRKIREERAAAKRKRYLEARGTIIDKRTLARFDRVYREQRRSVMHDINEKRRALLVA